MDERVGLGTSTVDQSDAATPPTTVDATIAQTSSKEAHLVPYLQAGVIEVRVWDKTVGAVALDPSSGFYAFEHDEEWVGSGIQLAPLHMPLGRGVFVFPELPERTFVRLPAMLADSLPDRFGNALVTAGLISEGMTVDMITPLDRLAYAGDRAMGALEYHPPAAPVNEHTTAIQLADLVFAARAALRGDFTDNAQTHDAIAKLIQVGTSAGGARAKAVICFNPTTGQLRSGQFGAPEGFEHWLLKLDGVGQDEQLGPTQGYGRVEFAYANMARAAGITMMPSRLQEENGRAHFMTQRFDRGAHGEKIHLQSLCAMDHLDFNSPDTHSYAQYLDVIDRLGLGNGALEEAFRRCVFNVAAANRDDHTKNFAFTCTANGQWSLAPAYDVIHSYNPVGRWTQRHQLSVNGKFEDITRTDLLEMADRFAVPAPTRVIGEVTDAVSRWPEFAEAAGVDQPRRDRVATDLESFRLT